MIKKLCTLLLLTAMSAPLLAQTVGSDCDAALFAPKKGQWQISVFLGGKNNFYNENTSSYLLPTNTYNGGTIGLPNGGTPSTNDNKGQGIESGNLNSYLQINGLNDNSLTNIIGFEGKYFLSDCWDINLQFSMDISLTPKKDYVESDVEVSDMVIPAQSYINAQMTNNWYISAGSNRYFKVNNPRIHPYLGGSLGFQMARIETTEPHTGEVYKDPDTGEELPVQVYTAGSRAGQMFGIKAAGVAGIEYSLAPGLVLGFQFQPLAYRYDVVQICPKGFDKYNASHHNIKFFDMPVLKLGIRF